MTTREASVRYRMGQNQGVLVALLLEFLLYLGVLYYEITFPIIYTGLN